MAFKYTILLLKIIILIRAQIRRMPGDSSATFTHTVKDVRFLSKPLLTINIGEPAKCLIRCLVHNQCKSININEDQNKCELLGEALSDKPRDVLHTENAKGWIYYGYEAEEDKTGKTCTKHKERLAYGEDEIEVCCAEGKRGRKCQNFCQFTYGDAGSVRETNQGVMSRDQCYDRCTATKRDIEGLDITGVTWGGKNGQVCFCEEGPIRHIKDLTSSDWETCILFDENTLMKPTRGTEDSPGWSCKDLKKRQPTLISGYYWIFLYGSPYKVYCEMQTDEGGWLMIAHSTVSQESDAQSNKYDAIKGDWNALSLSSSSFALQEDLMNDLHTQTQFTEIRIKCYKSWHERTLDVVIKDADFIRNYVGYPSATPQFCGNTRFLVDDNSLLSTKDCSSYKNTFNDKFGIFYHPIYISSEHVQIYNRMECDDYYGDSGFKLKGEWWYYVR